MGSWASSNRKNDAQISSRDIKSQIECIVNTWYRSTKYRVLSSDIINIIIHKLYQPKFETAHQNHLLIQHRILKLFNVDSKELIVEHRIESQDSKPQYIFSFYLVGDSGVGKSSFFSKYVNDEFCELIAPIDLDFKSKSIKINGKLIKLILWNEKETGGCDWLGYKGHGIMIFYDLTNRESFYNVRQWNHLDVPKIIIGCKSDIQSKSNNVSSDEIKHLAVKLNLDYIETSVKFGENLNEAVELMVTKAYEYQQRKDQQEFDKFMKSKPFNG